MFSWRPTSLTEPNMAVLENVTQEKVMVLCHKMFLETLYRSSGGLEEHLEMFDLRVPFMMDLEAEKVAMRMEGKEIKGKKKKRQLSHEDYPFPAEVDHLKKKLETVASLLGHHFPGQPSVQDFRENNKQMREAVKDLFSKLNCIELPRKGANVNVDALREGMLLMPPRCSFTTCDVAELEQHVTGQLDVIVMDPPWGNRHVKRVRWSTGYTMMSDNDPCLASLPISTLLRPGGLVLAWCTNSPKHRATLHDCFATWSVEEEATCFWLKLTRHGQLVSEFSSGKQPYEVLLVGRRKEDKEVDERSKAAEIRIPDGLVMLSVPSAIHSHKPPLTEVLERLACPTNPGGKEDSELMVGSLDKLELFGR